MAPGNVQRSEDVSVLVCALRPWKVKQINREQCTTHTHTHAHKLFPCLGNSVIFSSGCHKNFSSNLSVNSRYLCLPCLNMLAHCFSLRHDLATLFCHVLHTSRRRQFKFQAHGMHSAVQARLHHRAPMKQLSSIVAALAVLEARTNRRLHSSSLRASHSANAANPAGWHKRLKRLWLAGLLTHHGLHRAGVLTGAS